MQKVLVIILVIFIFFNIHAEKKSVAKAALLSAILPGSGELYSNNYSKASVFFTTEVAIILTYLRFNSETKWAEDSFRQFAYEQAGVKKNSSDEQYQRVQDFISLESYNSYIIQYYNYYLVYEHDPEKYHRLLDENLLSDDYFWEWTTDRDLKTYRDLRRHHRDLETYAKLTIAAGIVNHIVSTIDAVFSARRFNKLQKQLSRIDIEPDLEKIGFKLNYEYKF